MSQFIQEHEDHEGVVVPFRDAPLPEVPAVPKPRVKVLTKVRTGALRLAAVRPPHSVKVGARHVGYGALGVARGVGAWHRWVSALEYATNPKSTPELVEAVRKRRWRNTGITLGVTGAGMLTLWVWWWPALVVLGAGGLAVANGVEQLKRRTSEDQAHKALGTHPGSKAVRRAVAAAKLGKFDDIRVISPGVVREAAAYSVMVELPPGTPARNAVNKQAELASAAGVDVPQVAVDPVHGHAGRFLLWVADSDPLAGPPIPSPLVTRLTPFNVWVEKVPVGVDVRGRPLSFGLPERSLLVGGEPGGGKSVSCNNVLGAVSLDPWARLWTIDGKGGADLSDYEPIAERFLGEPDCEAALALLRDAQGEMSDRYRRLKAIGARKVNAELSVELDMRLLVIHLDEIQVFSTDETHGKAIVKALWDLVSRGRASGIVLSAATQRPAAEVVPSRLRDILSIRWALRCTTPQASDTVLGQGWAGRGFNAALIDSTQRGAGLLLAEGSTPAYLRSNFISDAELQVITRRAYRLREDAGTLPKSDARPAVRLLKDVLRAFGDVDRIATERLLVELTTHAAYSDWDATRLADELRPLDVRPGDRWIDSRNQRGYLRADVLKALDRA